MYCGWRPIQRVFRLKRRKRALIGREQTTGSAGGSDCIGISLGIPYTAKASTHFIYKEAPD